MKAGAGGCVQLARGPSVEQGWEAFSDGSWMPRTSSGCIPGGGGKTHIDLLAANPSKEYAVISLANDSTQNVESQRTRHRHIHPAELISFKGQPVRRLSLIFVYNCP